MRTSRKRRAAFTSAALIVLAFAALSAWVAWTDTTLPRLTRLVVTGTGASRDYRLLHVTDLHGARFGPEQRRLAELLGDRRYDVVLIGGDMITRSDDPLEPTLELLRMVKRHGRHVVFVVGNHDDARVIEAMRTVGVELLGEGRQLAFRRETGHIDLLVEGRWGDETLPAASASAPTVILSHIPPTPAEMSGLASGGGPPVLLLAGHTHGGQLRLPGVGAITAPAGWRTNDLLAPERLFPEVRGRYISGERRQGRLTAYVSPGLGTVVVPFRFLDRATITEIELRAER